MPSIYYQRNFQPNSYYHIYNRGAHKQPTFKNDNDYLTFLDILRYYLLFPTGKPLSRTDLQTLQVPNLSPSRQPVQLACFCLMPNHFHLLLKQHSPPTPSTSITNLMRRLSITYALFLHTKYNHSGSIFQGKFKNILIENDSYLLHLTRYIHQNPLELMSTSNSQKRRMLSDYPYSSHRLYLQSDPPSWLHPQPILKHFKREQDNPFLTYQDFVTGPIDESLEFLQHRSLEH